MFFHLFSVIGSIDYFYDLLSTIWNKESPLYLEFKIYEEEIALIWSEWSVLHNGLQLRTEVNIFNMLLSDIHYQQSVVLLYPIPFLVITFPIYLISHYCMCDYTVSTEHESGEEALFRDLCTRSVPTRQLKIYQSWLYRTNNLQLFVFSELTYFEIWFCWNENEIFHYLQGNSLCFLYHQI